MWVHYIKVIPNNLCVIKSFDTKQRYIISVVQSPIRSYVKKELVSGLEKKLPDILPTREVIDD